MMLLKKINGHNPRNMIRSTGHALSWESTHFLLKAKIFNIVSHSTQSPQPLAHSYN